LTDARRIRVSRMLPPDFSNWERQTKQVGGPEGPLLAPRLSFM